MRAFTTSDRVDPNEWWIMLVQGIASFVIGALLLVAPEKTVGLALQFLGLYWLITGIVSLVRVFVSHPDRPRWLNLLSGILGIVAGLAILNHPLWSTVLVPSVLVIFLGVEGILIGLLGIAQAIGGAGWRAALLGALSVVLGALLLASPLMAASVFVSIISVVAVVGGLVAIAGAVTLRAL